MMMFIFLGESITGSVLLELTEEDMMKLGINFGTRKTLHKLTKRSTGFVLMYTGSKSK